MKRTGDNILVCFHKNLLNSQFLFKLNKIFTLHITVYSLLLSINCCGVMLRAYENAVIVKLLVSASEQCLLEADAVAAASDQDLPLPQGMTRQWVADPEQLGVWQELSALDVDGEVVLRRRQLFSPAAYGLCKS